MQTDLITVAQAIAILDATPIELRVMSIGINDALGLRLAEDILADRDYPPFDKSLMDGYAVRSSDSGPRVIVGEIAAGMRADKPVGPGEAMAIMTGAPLPAGADAVVPVEECLVDAKTLNTNAKPVAGANITRRGMDCRAGAIVLSKGVRLGAAQLAVAASVGAAKMQVYQPPRAAVLTTGDELLAVDAAPGESQIRNSNNIMLASLLRQLGCDVTDIGTAPDQPEKIRAAIEHGLGFDLLFVSGGMSMGQYDFVPRILLELGIDLKITKLRIKPGKPFVFGVKGQSIIFGLPGNPVSGFVCTLRLCSRIISCMLGGNPVERWMEARLESPVEANGNREFYQPAILAGCCVQPLKWKGSADIYTLANANALIVRPENAPALPAGAKVRTLEIPS